ncbi:hypothetical protein CC80DRAFT_282410 [Byssothecium circinans]|uniref:Uncharacterized protein n=1 Tax=Byssothecium circinans TaxID=147558 RepID=A0A6A5T8I7_9PLEO|nr:hypothetical protein CC80DRAFT_282410 [Byssothecium circinans]
MFDSTNIVLRNTTAHWIEIETPCLASYPAFVISWACSARRLSARLSKFEETDPCADWPASPCSSLPLSPSSPVSLLAALLLCSSRLPLRRRRHSSQASPARGEGTATARATATATATTPSVHRNADTPPGPPACGTPPTPSPSALRRRAHL